MTEIAAAAPLRSESQLFRPIEAKLLDRPVDLITTGRMMRENPLSILPEMLLRETILSGPYLGAKVHEIAGPQEMRSVLLDDAASWRKSPLILRMLRPVLGDAILTAHGESWRRQRLIMQPAFMKRRIERFYPLMDDVARDTAERFAGAAEGRVEAASLLTDATFQVIERALFSSPDDFDRQDVRRAIEVLLEEIGTMRMSDLLPVPEWAPRLMTPAALRARSVFRRAASGQIAQRRERSDPGDDLLGLLLSARNEETGEALSDIDIRDTLMTFIAAGHETTSIALTWSLYLLSNDEEAQARVRAEARAAFASDRPADASTLAALAFTRQVIEEAMRLFPPAPVLGRRAIAHTQIGEREVRKGDVCLLAFYCLHRHETLWEHPHHFDPDRFSPERRPRERYAYLPFGGGARACIGAQFALSEAALMLARIISSCEIAPEPDYAVEPMMQVTLRPAGGLKLHVTPL
ncbi:MAG: cytochrome P450 [Pseudomonadota bacterium]